MATPVPSARTSAPPTLRAGVQCVYDLLAIDGDLSDLADHLEGLPLLGATECRTVVVSLRRELQKALLRFDAKVTQAVRAWEAETGCIDELARFDGDDEAPF